MQNKTYDLLKWIAIAVLPASATFVGAVGLIWGWEYTEPVVLTITAVDVLLGALVGVSAVSYTKAKHAKQI